MRHNPFAGAGALRADQLAQQAVCLRIEGKPLARGDLGAFSQPDGQRGKHVQDMSYWFGGLVEADPDEVPTG